MDNTQTEIDKLKLKIYRGYLSQEKLIDYIIAVIIFIVIFGIGFTFGYYHCKF